ncbi:MAG: YtxH domain-containing protein [Bacteroides sp.]|nr:YtxH domain-containing protein [Bacteroides sp.]
MKALTAILALAGTAGIGYLVYKKMTEKKENASAYTEYKEESRKGGKIRRASMYAVGTIKTTADKISEGIKQVKSEDMVKKGEETIEHLKETGESFKEQVKETTGSLKEQVKETTVNLKEQVKETTGNIKGELKETGGNIKDELKETGGSIKDELKEIKNLVTSINVSPSDAAEDYDDSAPVGIPEAEVEELDDDESALFEEIEIVDQL